MVPGAKVLFEEAREMTVTLKTGLALRAESTYEPRFPVKPARVEAWGGFVSGGLRGSSHGRHEG